MISIYRYHDISVGHRICGHESHCARLHGHNYRIHFTCTADELDALGRVLDFQVVKERLCQWLEDHWDHRFLVWDKDPLLEGLRALDPSVSVLPCNPSAENMARYLGEVVGPAQLEGTGARLVAVEVEETAKCKARWSL